MQAQLIFSSQGQFAIKLYRLSCSERRCYLEDFLESGPHLALGQLFSQGPPIDDGQGVRNSWDQAPHHG